jgi:hypothetical protein
MAYGDRYDISLPIDVGEIYSTNFYQFSFVMEIDTQFSCSFIFQNAL